MNKKQIKQSFPLTYELFKAATNGRTLKKIRQHEQQFFSMSKEELMAYDAALYEKRQGKSLDWNNLQTYTEKIQWAKLFDNDERKALLSDKYKVRNWVADKIGEEYVIPLIGVWDSFDQIDFSALPNEFVLKTNRGSNDVFIVRDKAHLKLHEKLKMKRVIETSLHTNHAAKYCEMHYNKIEPKIIAEKFIDSGESDLKDYKFLCFNGVPYYCWVDVGRYTNHKRNVYDLNWNLQPWNQFHYGNSTEPVEKPKNFDKMVELVTILCRDFSHVRVDLYNNDGVIYFGEMTFANGSGFEEITPSEMDLELGNLWGPIS